MAEFYLLLIAVMTCFLGMSWFALSLNTHWQQLRAAAKPPIKILRSLAALALSLSLLLCLLADHPSIAVLVWVMLMAGSAVSITMLLAWRPNWLNPFIIWIPR